MIGHGDTGRDRIDAIDRRVEEPAVALETTVLTTGLPEPSRAEAIRRMQAGVVAGGANPAWVGVLDGRPVAGLSPDELERLVAAGGKLAARGLAIAIARGESGGTTVSATLALARRAGIEVAATGGIGGVHRGGPDVSADLLELARGGGVLVCSGAKAVLDLPATLEALETLSVPVVGWRTDVWPAFWSRDSGLPVSARVESAAEVADVLRASRAIGGEATILVCSPVPEPAAIERAEIDAAVESALADLDAAGIEGPAVTPFLLERVAERTDGRSLEANLALLEENARVAGAIAASLAGSSG